jgi:hypothetical protein
MKTNKCIINEDFTRNPTVGELMVWWIPQVPMKAFEVPVDSLELGVKIMDTLAMYDIFQYENKIKPDYCNAGGINRWTNDCDGEGNPGWESWYDEETGEDDPVRYLEDKRANV